MIPVWRPRGDSNPRYRRERELPDGNLQKTQARIALQRALKHPLERLLNPYRTLAGYRWLARQANSGRFCATTDTLIFCSDFFIAASLCMGHCSFAFARG